jgi:DNA-binding PadR family transcriptional regulator
MIELLDLLWAVTTKDQHTTPKVAAALGASEPETERALRSAERDGWVVEDMDESRNVPPEFDRQFWHITEEGQSKMHRLEDESGRYR